MSQQLTAAQHLALTEAAQWFAEMQSGTAPIELKISWQQWLAQNDTNRWAWQQLEQLQTQLGNLPNQLSFDTLASKKQVDRRHILRSFVVLATLGVTGWASVNYTPARRMLADYHTGTGETRTINLTDGSEIILNTASAINVTFSVEKRLITLLSGEIMVKTGHSADLRPFFIEGRDGLLQPMGTRFSVFQTNTHSVLSVFEHQVALHSVNAGPLLCKTGDQFIYRAGQLQQQQRQQGDETDWLNGKLVANDMPLDEFVATLSRYRPGLLSCNPNLSRFRISGTFQLNNTDQALSAIVQSFPIRIDYKSRFWVTVTEM